MDSAIHQALQRLEELATKGAIDANQLKVRQDQLRQQDRVAKLAAVSGCYIGKEGKPVAASATTGMASLDHDVLQHMLSFVKSYPRCVIGHDDKQLLIAKPLRTARCAGGSCGPGRTGHEGPGSEPRRRKTIIPRRREVPGRAGSAALAASVPRRLPQAPREEEISSVLPEPSW